MTNSYVYDKRDGYWVLSHAATEGGLWGLGLWCLMSTYFSYIVAVMQFSWWRKP